MATAIIASVRLMRRWTSVRRGRSRPAWGNPRDGARVPSSLHGRSRICWPIAGGVAAVATLVARGLPPTEIFAAVAEETGARRFDGGILRFEADRTATVIAGWSEPSSSARARNRCRLTLEGDGIRHGCFGRARPDRPLPRVPPAVVGGSAGTRVQSAAGAPIIVEDASGA